jgi:hypothetical protein
MFYRGCSTWAERGRTFCERCFTEDVLYRRFYRGFSTGDILSRTVLQGTFYTEVSTEDVLRRKFCRGFSIGDALLRTLCRVYSAKNFL